MKVRTLAQALLIALPLTLAACSTTKSTSGTDQGMGANSGVQSGAGSEMTVEQAEAARLAQLRAENKVIYFDYDSNAIRPEYNDILANHGKFLASNPNIHVVINGHTDERGSPEYNIGLGERRAKAVATILMSYGVSPSQIETVSYGEERPADPGHDEEAWAKNRRAELNY